MNILVVDDDILVLKSLKKLLSRAGYSVVLARTPEEAIARGIEEIDLIICDVKIPSKNGINIVSEIKEIRRSQNKPSVPFIFITGYDSKENPLRAKALGAVDYIYKPFDLDHLLDTVKKALKGNV